jgi:hypothetical protein
MRSRLPFVAFALLCASIAPAAALDCAAPAIADRIAAIPARGELLLESGVLARLAGVRLADAGAVGAAARAEMDGLVGTEVAVALLEADADRWGRRAAAIAFPAAEGAPPMRDLAAGLVERGLALVDAGPADRLCRPGLLELEEEARRGRRGIWADAGERPLPAGAGEALAARVGRFTLVEGVVVRVGVRGDRTYLDFSRSWTSGFTAVVPAPVWARLEASGLGAGALEGRRMRVRGIIEMWRGPALTITAVEMIEILSSNSAEPRRFLP